jgi:hypothetical protein
LAELRILFDWTLTSPDASFFLYIQSSARSTCAGENGSGAETKKGPQEPRLEALCTMQVAVATLTRKAQSMQGTKTRRPTMHC